MPEEWEVTLWRACKFFHCLPSELEHENPLILRRILLVDLWARSEENKRLNRTK